MIRQRELNAIWAGARELFEDPIAEAITHLYIAINFGRHSLRDLTKEEAHELIVWLLDLAEASS